MKKASGTLDLFAPPASAPEPAAPAPNAGTFDAPAEKVKSRTELIAATVPVEPAGEEELTGTPVSSEAMRASFVRDSDLRIQRRIFWRQLQQSDPGIASPQAHPEAPTDAEIDRCINWILRGIASDAPPVTQERIRRATDDLAAYSWALNVDQDWEPYEWPEGQRFDLLAKRAASFPYALPPGAGS